MKTMIVIGMAIYLVFVNQLALSEVLLSPKQIEIKESYIRPGPKFGDGWSERQKKVWKKTQEWWQIRMVMDWGKLKNLYHKDAILYHYFYNVPFNFSEYEILAGNKYFSNVTCTVHDIRIIENVGIVMLYYEIRASFKIPSKRMIFVWMKQDDDWKLIADMSKEE